MNEKTLLFISLTTTIIGISALMFLPELPPEKIRGEVLWSNGTSIKLGQEIEIWVELDTYTTLEKGFMIEIEGNKENDRVTNGRVLRAYQPSPRPHQ